MTEKLTPIERALVAAAAMSVPDARRVLMLICQGGMTMNAPRGTSPGDEHYAKREKFIKRIKSAADRVLNYARHETLRNTERHFRETGLKSAEEDQPKTTAARITFDKTLLGEELAAAVRDEQEQALQTAGQQLYDEVGRDDPFKIPDKQAIDFLDTRENLLAGASDDLHREVMNEIQDGLNAGDTRKQLMDRINAAFDGISSGRAETIANTETAAAFNFARDKAMRKAGVQYKKWLFSQSPLIKEHRPTHVEAGGQTVPVDEPFDISGVKFMHPGDDSLGAGPEDIINCHCVAIPTDKP